MRILPSFSSFFATLKGATNGIRMDTGDYEWDDGSLGWDVCPKGVVSALLTCARHQEKPPAIIWH
jgi:hypothetical protein